MGSSSSTRDGTWAPTLGAWNLSHYPGRSLRESQASGFLFQGADHDLHTPLSGGSFAGARRTPKESEGGKDVDGSPRISGPPAGLYEPSEGR